MRFVLTGDPNPRLKLRGVVAQEAGSLTISVDGYNEGLPIVGLILQDGHLRLLVFNDIESDEPVTVELEGARE